MEKIIYNQFPEIAFKSSCKINQQDKRFLLGIFKGKIGGLSLHYRASRDGWMPFDFHSKSDNIGPSITLFQINNGDCIGGFSYDNWSSPESWKGESEKSDPRSHY
jgi:hypothetical protein